MSSSVNDDTAMLPSDLERQQIFYWLKKLNSLTAWRRILSYYKAWAAATESSLRVAQERGWGDRTSLPAAEYALIMKCLAHCEEGVRRLSKGDKRVFKFDHNGEFVMASRMLSHWSKMKVRIEMGENGINEACTPKWEEFLEALLPACHTWGECGSEILEPRYLDEPGLNWYGMWLKKELTTMPFPDDLPHVPEPVENIFVRTNDWTTYSGIWEPVAAPPPPQITLRNLFARTPKPQAPFTVVGTMNYLHAYSKAPAVNVETETDINRLDTTWRLLWRDDRYNDGTVPEEENHYRFTTPNEEPPHVLIATEESIRAVYERFGIKPATTPTSVPGGGPCVRTGYYFTPAKADSTRLFQEGDTFPDFTSSYGQAVWQWSTDQDGPG